VAVKAFADTNWLVASYFRTLDSRRTAVVDRFISRFEERWIISVVVEMECANTFRALASDPSPVEWKAFTANLGDRIHISTDTWGAIAAGAADLLARFSHKGRVGTLDVMILASALKCGATHFLSFDMNSSARALAAVLKLKVFPELTDEDRRRMQRFR
jgi:predicted nucleic acid-binding protein